VNTNTNNTTVNSTSNNTNTNNNTNNTTVNSTSNNTNTNNNNNNTTVNSTSNNTNNNTNTNINESNSTSNNTNTNNNYSESNSNSNVNSTSESKSENKNENINTNNTKITQEIKSPPPSAIAPSIGSSYSQDLCTTGISGAVQTQVLGLSGGKSIRDMNCERIKLSKTLYDMGMKVAAVSTMCQDERVWKAMMMAGTPCPFEGEIGKDALDLWAANPDLIPDNALDEVKIKDEEQDGSGVWKVLGGGALLLLLL